MMTDLIDSCSISVNHTMIIISQKHKLLNDICYLMEYMKFKSDINYKLFDNSCLIYNFRRHPPNNEILSCLRYNPQ